MIKFWEFSKIAFYLVKEWVSADQDSFPLKKKKKKNCISNIN